MGEAVSLFPANNLQPPLRRWLEEPLSALALPHSHIPYYYILGWPYKKITLSRSTSSIHFPEHHPGQQIS